MELPQLFRVGSKNKGTARAETQQFLVDCLGKSDPSFDAPFANDLKMAFVADEPKGVPGQPCHFRLPTPGPQKHLGCGGCQRNPTPSGCQIIHERQEFAAVELSNGASASLDPSELRPRVGFQQFALVYNATDTFPFEGVAIDPLECGLEGARPSQNVVGTVARKLIKRVQCPRSSSPSWKPNTWNWWSWLASFLQTNRQARCIRPFVYFNFAGRHGVWGRFLPWN